MKHETWNFDEHEKKFIKNLLIWNNTKLLLFFLNKC